MLNFHSEQRYYFSEFPLFKKNYQGGIYEKRY
jgi:hypothetical protein